MKKNLLGLLFSIACLSLQAQWPTPSAPVLTGLFHSTLAVDNVSKVIDVNGNIFIAAENPNINGSDIWIQKMDSSGNLLWGFAGVQVQPGTATQKFPVVLADQNGGCFLGYFDDNAPFGAFVQHYDASGNPLLNGRGRKLLSHTSNFWDDLSMVTDGQYLYCTMTLEKPATNDQVYAQKMDYNLNLQWDTTGIAVSPAANEYQNRTCLPDGNGGLLVLFTRYFSNVNQVFRVQHLDAAGNLLWNAGAGTELNNGTPAGDGRSLLKQGPQRSHYVCWDGGTNALFSGIYLSKVDSAGNKPWGTSALTVIDTTNVQDLPDLAIDTNGNAYVSWRDRRSVTGHDCHVQKINNTGSKLWGLDGVAIDTLHQPQYIFPRIGLFNNGLHVYWCAYTSDYVLKKQVLDSNGTKRCVPTGFDMTSPGFTPIIDDYLLPMPQGGICVLLSNLNAGPSLYIEYDHTGCVLPTGIFEHPENDGLQVFPNPVSDVLTIQMTQGLKSGSLISLYDLNGRILLEKVVPENTSTCMLSLHTLAEGIYIIKVGEVVLKVVK